MKSSKCWKCIEIVNPTTTLFCIGIRDSQAKSGQSRLNRNGWTLCKEFWGIQEQVLLAKNQNFKSSNCWICIETVNPTTTLFCVILNLLRSNQASLFGFCGVRAHPSHPSHPSCLRACTEMKLGPVSCKYCPTLLVKRFQIQRDWQ